MFDLSRVEYPDLVWGTDELDDVGALWLAWHEQAQAKRVRPLVGYLSVRMKLSGFARPDGDALADKLEANLATAQLDFTVNLTDPDYLVVTQPFEEVSECELGGWLGLVKDREFDGLVMLLEVTFHDWPGLPEGPAAAGGTLVLCGQLRRDGFLLKAIWPTGVEPGIETMYKFTVWPGQVGFLEALASFRRGMMPTAADDYFAGRLTQRHLTWFASLLFHIPGRDSFEEGRLASFLLRTGGLALILVLVALVYGLNPHWPGTPIVIGAVAPVPAALLVYIVWVEASRVWTFYWRMKAAMHHIYSRPLEHRAVTLADYGLAGDPYAAKYSRELELLGCQHLGDICHVHESTGRHLIRIFVLPDERTYVCLMLMASAVTIKKFPAHAYFVTMTYLTDGRVVTINEGGGYRKSLIPSTFSRRFPGVDDPATLLAKHRKFVGEICAQGHELAPLMGLPELLEQMREDHEELRPVMERWGYYSLAAAFRQSFDLVRSEYLDPDDQQ